MHRLALVLAILALSCGNNARPDFVVHLVDASNNSPFNQCNSGTVRVDVQQSTNAVLTSNANITGTMLSSLSVEIPSFGLTTQIEVTVSCVTSTETITLIGATPHFIPVGYGFVDIVLGQPQTCELLSSPRLDSPRVGPMLVSLNANLIALGGLEGVGGSRSIKVQSLDPMTLTTSMASALFDRLSQPIGVGSAAPLGNSTLVFASDSQSGMYDATPNVTTRVQMPTGTGIHQGANADSAVVGLNGLGVAIVGGSLGGTPVSDITWIDANGASITTQLAHPRRRPAAVAFGSSRLLVVGGQAAGEPLFEMMLIRDDTPVTFGSTTELRYDPVVVTDTAHSRAFVALGRDAFDGGAVQTSTWVVSTCMPTGCAVDPGPVFADPRSDVAFVPHHVGVPGAATPTDDFEALVFGGTDAGGHPSALIDRMHVGPDGPATITPFGNLMVPRTSPGAADIGGGIVIVAGGIDDHGNAVDTLEICFPAALRPIGPPD